LHDIGKHDEIRANEFLIQWPRADFNIPLWFYDLLSAGQQFTRKRRGVRDNVLEFAPSPGTGREWVEQHQDIIYEQLIEERFDTAGLDEAYGIDDDEGSAFSSSPEEMD
jgi:hypothetical protein